MSETFRALRYHGRADAPEPTLESLRIDQLSEGDTLIEVHFASVNYKDALAGRGHNKIIRELPRIGGIDLSGRVLTSADSSLRPGTEVVVHGFGVGVDHDGGYAQRARVPASWVLPLPQGLGMREAAALGVAGYTAALSVHRLEQLGLRPQNGPVVITGASGGSGSIALDILAGRGYEVSVVSGKAAMAGWFAGLGAREVLPREVFGADARPMLGARWAGAIDTVGGDALSWLVRTMRQDGLVAAFGNAGGLHLNTSVLPFILRGVHLMGINANSPMPLRREVWARMATDLRAPHLEQLIEEIGLADLPAAFDRLLASQVSGRLLVDLARD
ncbi:MAG: acryloyl-CoA reductase [Burkholderiaceae bacterium]